MIAGFKAQNHPSQVAGRGSIDEVDDRATPDDAYAEWSVRFGGFTLDVAASTYNAKCPDFFTRADNGLDHEWAGRVWCNPPYSDIAAWIRKAHAEWGQGHVELIVMLLPANRTDQGWWHELVESQRDGRGAMRAGLTVEFLRGRLRFVFPPGIPAPKHNRPLFGCCLLIWQRPTDPDSA